MKVYLDDLRTPPNGFILVNWPSEAIELLKTGQVKEISLDHDLGNDDIGTGYDVILWIEEQVAINKFNPPIIKVHSANSSARLKMEAGIKTIQKLSRRNEMCNCNSHSKINATKCKFNGLGCSDEDKCTQKCFCKCPRFKYFQYLNDNFSDDYFKQVEALREAGEIYGEVKYLLRFEPLDEVLQHKAIVKPFDGENIAWVKDHVERKPNFIKWTI